MCIMLRVKGRRACFSRPELKVEAVSYDVMTPTAARAIVGCIYWKPQIEWVVDGILVLNPIRTAVIKQNLIDDKISAKAVARGSQKPFDVTSMRDQRNSTILIDVDYIIKAHFDIVSGEDNTGKHLDMFMRRAEKGQCFRHPYFGCRDFSVDSFELIQSMPLSQFKGIKPLGYMLHSIDYTTNKPAFWDAQLSNGYLSVPLATSKEVKR